ncbi:hypothetical protein BB559_002243 [Furculomyces boomerangus]|uniref:Sec1-like protein n=1 Tax=Furculomyces boomerangus TaxID=61424 RepID=A0A2T9YWT7_9FUNG|nr:hypothetical protein BB559_002243 [Furculomyces boomerangus]
MSLIELQRNQFLNALESVRPPSRHKIVVVDSRSLKVLGSILKLSEILEYDVLRIDNIEKRRKPEPETDAMYILTPSELSVSLVIDDYTKAGQMNIKGGMMYKAAHLFFTSELPENLFNKISSSPLKKHIAALKELCIEYDPIESNFFLTKLADYEMFRLFSKQVAENTPKEIEVIAKKLANACKVLGEKPSINYFMPMPDSQAPTVSREVAFFVHSELEKSFSSGNDLNDSAGNEPPKSKLLIVDRSIDMYAPLLHEFTYEAMAMDLVNDKITDSKFGKTYKYSVEIGKGQIEEKTAELNESDKAWMKYRYEHISDAQHEIQKDIELLAKNNKAIINLQSGEKQSLNKLKDVVGAMPKFKAQMAEYSVHVSLMQECMKLFNFYKLDSIGLIEQNLVVGQTPEKKKYSTASFDIAEILSSNNVQEHIKQRLLLIYSLANPNISDQERTHLVSRANLDRTTYDAIVGLQNLVPFAKSLNLSKKITSVCERSISSARSRSSSHIKGLGLGGKSGSPLLSLRSISKTYGSPSPLNNGNGDSSPTEEKEPYDVSRYVPVLKSILEAAVLGNLDKDMFPNVVPLGGDQSGKKENKTLRTNVSSIVSINVNPPDRHTSIGSREGSRSLRSTKPSWQKNKSPSADISPLKSVLSTSLQNSPMSSSGTPSMGGGGYRRESGSPRNYDFGGDKPKLIVFVVGGITYSEIRAMNELKRKHNCSFVLGSSHIISSPRFVTDLASIAHDSYVVSGKASTSGVSNQSLPFVPSCDILGYGCSGDIDPLVKYKNNQGGPTLDKKGGNVEMTPEELFMEKLRVSEKNWEDIKSSEPSMGGRSGTFQPGQVSSMHRIQVKQNRPGMGGKSETIQSGPASTMDGMKPKPNAIKRADTGKKGFLKKFLS